MIYLFSWVVCIIPVFSTLLPFIPGLNVSTIWIFYYLLCFVFVISFAMKPNWYLLNPWLLILTIYYTICGASVLWSDFYTFDLTTIRDLIRNCLGPYLIAMMALYILRSEKAIHIYMQSFTYAAVAASLIAFYQMLFNAAPVFDTVRAVGNFRNPNLMAIFLVLCLPCTLYLIRFKKIPLLLGWPAFMLINAGILCTVSRKGVFTALLTGCLFLFLSGQVKKLISFSVAALLAGGILLVSSDAIRERFAADNILHNLAHKIEFVNYGRRMFLENPVAGLGYRGFYASFGKYAKGASVKNYQAHNIFITEIANRGIIGFIPFMGIFLIPLLVCKNKLFPKKQAPPLKEMEKGVAIVTLCSLLSFMFNGYFAGGLFFNFLIMFPLYSNIACILSYRDDPKAAPEFRPWGYDAKTV